MPDLRPLLEPNSIAVVGASAQQNKVGGMPIRLLRENGYTGAIYPVHRSDKEIQGLRAYASLEDIGSPVDLSIVAVPATECESVMEQMTRSGTRAAIFFTSGFAETSEEGARLQKRLSNMARESGIALLGPNCLGAMNLHKRIYATFSPVVLGGTPAPGEVGLASQSGAFGGYAFSLARKAGIGIGHWITTGNEAGVQLSDAITWLSAEPACKRILAYLEGARDINRLRDALLAARAANKPVTIVKVGHTSTGARASKLHTASDTGDAIEYQRLFDECGVRTARTISELFSGATDCKEVPQAHHQPIAIFTISGGVGIMMADRAEELGLAMPPLPEEAASRLKSAIPFASTINPIDVTGQVFSQPMVLMQALRDAATCGRYSRIAVFLAAAGSVPGLWPMLQDCILQLRANPSAARLVLSGILSAEQQAWLSENDCTVFSEPTHAVEELARGYWQGSNNKV